jgi:hypothetical protein
MCHENEARPEAKIKEKSAGKEKPRAISIGRGAGTLFTTKKLLEAL